MKGHSMPKIKISIISTIWLIYLLISNTPFIIPLICAIILHECGHLFFALLLKIKIQSFELSIMSARIKTYGDLSYIDELIFALGGPLFGLLGFLFTFKFALHNLSLPIFQNFIFPFSVLSLCLALFNLIPLASLDGGRILKCLLCLTFSLNFAEKAIQIVSFLSLFSLWLLSVYMILKITSGLPMFVFCLIFFSKCFIWGKKSRDFASF